MALLDKGLKQRIVGALVLVALAVIFLPMLLSRQDERASIEVEVPTAPVSPGMPETVAPPVEVPVASEPVPGDVDQPLPLEPQPLVEPATPAQVESSRPAAAASETPASRLDEASLPVSWSVQLASLSSRPGAEALQKTLRSQGYNAYIRQADGMNRVFVGPVIERKEADRLRDQLNRQHKLSGFVVRFQPERS
ncbi:SPOR domain-containing protein [Pseudomonas mangrovi]|uniref:Cell division protein n=1 Tax=Pseudomonas mangrovi TaxID=2161748 RepID=A0A2T5P4M7_9PSED|nr:SPOR domain-containing protein [Pseudomonas mangrovi]PTU72699.1 cell division protein [Pseudomonas mangrovi]